MLIILLYFIILGSKTKVKWQYGYTNSEMEHTIEFKISFLSGNKVWMINFKCFISLYYIFIMICSEYIAMAEKYSQVDRY